MTKIRQWYRYVVRYELKRKKDSWLIKLAAHTPRSLRYWIVINSAVQASAAHPRQAVPTLTWEQLLEVNK